MTNPVAPGAGPTKQTKQTTADKSASPTNVQDQINAYLFQLYLDKTIDQLGETILATAFEELRQIATEEI